MIASIAIALGALGGVALCFCSPRVRWRGGILRMPAWVRGNSLRLAAGLAVLQTAAGLAAYGAAAATALIPAAWMLAGSLFVPLANYRPQVMVRAALACASAASVLSLVSLALAA